MTIPHTEERKKLLALYQQIEAIEEEEKTVVAPLEDVAAAEWREVIAEHRAAGGKWPGGIEDYAKNEVLHLKCEPARQAVKEAKAPFTARMDAVSGEIAKIEDVIGKISEDYWRGEGRASCAMTGLPILESDKVGVVIAAALPATAAIHTRPEPNSALTDTRCW